MTPFAISKCFYSLETRLKFRGIFKALNDLRFKTEKKKKDCPVSGVVFFGSFPRQCRKNKDEGDPFN